MSESHDSRAVANELLRVAQENGKSLTIMQLIKLTYLAHGFTLGVLNRPLTSHEVQAWQHGPVFPHVYKAFKDAGSLPIAYFAKNKGTGIEYVTKFTAEEREILQGVVESYGSMHAFELSSMLHREGEPWAIIYNRDGAYKPIPNELIKSHFDKLLKTDNAAVEN
jgi:uncharacterized phage-associated protein